MGVHFHPIHRHFPRAKGEEIEMEKMYPHNTIQRGEGAETENWLDEKNPLMEIPLA